MAEYYKQKKQSRSYIDDVSDFVSYTLLICSKLPARWTEVVIKYVIEAVQKIDNYTVLANKVYVNNKTQTADMIITAIKERLKYLYEALRWFDVYPKYISLQSRVKKDVRLILR